MNATPLLTPETDHIGESQRCAVCDHDVADHDAIGTRYCRATQARALGRGCICR